MKKMTFLACAAMLTSAIAFTGCKGDQNAPEKAQEVVKTNPVLTACRVPRFRRPACHSSRE